MSKFAKGLKKGHKIRQGDVIGYVGTTGRSTGPHLHYEILVAGAQVNPAKVKTVASNKLSGSMGPMSAIPANVTASCNTRMGLMESRQSSSGMNTLRTCSASE